MSDRFQDKYRIPSARLKNWDYRREGMYFVTICTRKMEHYFGEIINNEMALSETGNLCKNYLEQIPEHFPFVRLNSSVIMPNHLHAIIIIDKSFQTSMGKMAEDGGVVAFDSGTVAFDGRDVAIDDRDVAFDGGDVAIDSGDVAIDSGDVSFDSGDVSLDGRDVAFDGGDVAFDGRDVALDGRDVALDGRDVACNVSTPTITCNHTPNIESEKPKNTAMASISPKSGSLSTIMRSFKSAVTGNVRQINKLFDWQPRFYDHIIRDKESYQYIKHYIENNTRNWDSDKFRN